MPLDPVSFETEPPYADTPDIIVIGSLDEVAPPAVGVKYPKEVMDILSNLDYNRSFAILFLVGQVQNNIIINGVVRKGSKVTIELNDYSIGSGNYIVPGYTLPYQLIVVEKSGTWGEDIHFVFKTDQADILAESDHYIP